MHTLRWHNPPRRRQISAWESRRRVGSLLHEAGFVQIDVRSEQLGYYFRTVEEYWAELSASLPWRPVLQLTPAQRAQLKAEHLAEVGALATDQGIWRDVATNFAHGWKCAT
jgi:hypothetical protein